MGVPKPSEARLVLRHYEDGRMSVLFDGKVIPGVVSASFSQESGMSRDVLNLSIIGLAVRIETSPHKQTHDPARVKHRQEEEASQ